MPTDTTSAAGRSRTTCRQCRTIKRSIVGWLARCGCIHDDTKAQAPPCARLHCLQRITLQMIGPDVSLAERVEVDGLAAPRERRRHAGLSGFIDESLHPGIEPAEPHGRHGDRLGSGAREVAAIASRNRGGMPLADRRETRPNGYHRKEDGDPSEPACHGDLQIGWPSIAQPAIRVRSSFLNEVPHGATTAW
jgi:hypothetical protein